MLWPFKIKVEDQNKTISKLHNIILKEYPQFKIKKDLATWEGFFFNVWVEKDPRSGKSPAELFLNLYNGLTHRTCNEVLINGIDEDSFRLEIAIEIFESECLTGESKKISRKGLIFCGKRRDCYENKYEEGGLQKCNEQMMDNINDSPEYNFLYKYIIEEMKEIADFKYLWNLNIKKEMSWKKAIMLYVQGDIDDDGLPTKDNFALKHEEIHMKDIVSDIRRKIRTGEDRKYLGMNISYTLKNCIDDNKAKIFEFERDFCECFKSCKYKESEFCGKLEYDSTHMDEILMIPIKNIIKHKYMTN